MTPSPHHITHSNLNPHDMPKWKSLRDRSQVARWHHLTLRVNHLNEFVVLEGSDDSDSDTLPMDELGRGVALTRERAVVACEEFALAHLIRLGMYVGADPRTSPLCVVAPVTSPGQCLGVLMLRDGFIDLDALDKDLRPISSAQVLRLLVGRIADVEDALQPPDPKSKSNAADVVACRRLAIISRDQYRLRTIDVAHSRAPAELMFQITPNSLNNLLPAISAQLGEEWTVDALYEAFCHSELLCVVVCGLMRALQYSDKSLRGITDIASDTLTRRITLDVLHERQRQAQKWGRNHDRLHTSREWVDLMLDRIHKASVSSFPSNEAIDAWRKNILEIGAMSIAILECGGAPLHNEASAHDPGRIARLNASAGRSDK